MSPLGAKILVQTPNEMGEGPEHLAGHQHGDCGKACALCICKTAVGAANRGTPLFSMFTKYEYYIT